MPGWRYTKKYPGVFTSFGPLTRLVDSFTKGLYKEEFGRMAIACLGSIMRMADYVPGTVHQIRMSTPGTLTCFAKSMVRSKNKQKCCY